MVSHDEGMTGCTKPGGGQGTSLQTRNTCQVHGCTHTPGSVRFAYRGWFCDHHLVTLQHIRHNLAQAKLRNSLEDEIHWRVQEMLCRKHTDGGHWRILCLLIGRVESDMYPMYTDILYRLKMFLGSCPNPVQPVLSKGGKQLQRRWMGEDRYILAY